MTGNVVQIRDYQPNEAKVRILERQMADITRELVDFCTGLGTEDTESAPMIATARDTAACDPTVRYGCLGADTIPAIPSSNAMPYGNSPKEIAKRRLKAFTLADNAPSEMNMDEPA